MKLVAMKMLKNYELGDWGFQPPLDSLVIYVFGLRFFYTTWKVSILKFERSFHVLEFVIILSFSDIRTTL